MTSRNYQSLKALFLLLKQKQICTANTRTYVKKSVSDYESLFISPKVQELLNRITGFDIDKILKARPIKEVETPKYKLLTTKQLKELQEEAKQKARRFLHMPPYKQAWNTEVQEEDILADDKELLAYDKSDSAYTFVDISPGIKTKERSVVVREASGLLRNAKGEERDSLLNIYYPRPGRMTIMPQMFQQEALERLLKEQRYEYILARACVQFEPDDPHYLRVTHRTFEHILTTGQYEELRSTRFFGPMTFYLLLHKKIDLLLCDMLDRSLIEDAVDLLRLHHIMHPRSAVASSLEPSAMELLKTYIEQEATDKIALKMSLEGFERRQTSAQASVN